MAADAAGAPAPTVAGAAASSTGAAAPTATSIAVHVVGQVRSPGVVTLPAGSRVQDAVTKAGGALPSADLSDVNLARTLVDGEQIRVPKPGETVTPVSPPIAAAPGAASGGSGGTGGAAGGAGSGVSAGASAPVNINTADLTALDALPGVGPVLAQRIVDWRTSNGRFTSVDELGEVSGIGDKMLERLRPHVVV